MFVRPWLRVGDLSCVFQALVVFSIPQLCLSDIGYVSEILVVFFRP